MHNLNSLGVMIDMSRNAVMSPDGLNRYLPLLVEIGYNTVLLYTEDTYEVNAEPYFGYMRGRYTNYAKFKRMIGINHSFLWLQGQEFDPCQCAAEHDSQCALIYFLSQRGRRDTEIFSRCPLFYSSFRSRLPDISMVCVSPTDKIPPFK